ncbi:hypothetical protein [Pseudoalteromonas aurantia]|nr:hypothetical protein [Pseudoalteromonas aurantia]
MGSGFTIFPSEQEIQENQKRIAEARASMSAKNNEKSKDKSRDI